MSDYIYKCQKKNWGTMIFDDSTAFHFIVVSNISFHLLKAISEMLAE